MPLSVSVVQKPTIPLDSASSGDQTLVKLSGSRHLMRRQTLGFWWMREFTHRCEVFRPTFDKFSFPVVFAIWFRGYPSRFHHIPTIIYRFRWLLRRGLCFPMCFQAGFFFYSSHPVILTPSIVFYNFLSPFSASFPATSVSAFWFFVLAWWFRPKPSQFLIVSTTRFIDLIIFLDFFVLLSDSDHLVRFQATFKTNFRSSPL